MSNKEKAIVIGAGMGGLSTAIRLAVKGFSVTVIEMADQPGGKARAVQSIAGPIDTGPTVLTLRTVVDEIFALCGTRIHDEVELCALPRLARHFWPDGSQLDLFPDTDANIEAIHALCGPKEAEAFRRFDQLSAALYAAFDAPVMQASRPAFRRIVTATLRQPRLWPALMPGISLDRLLRKHFRDPRLIQLFGRYATYVGGQPDTTPAVLALIWRAEAAGVWAVRQGMQGLAEALARLAAAKGVEFRYATRAQRIIRRENRVTGVELSDGTTLPCTACVFNGDPGALRDGLLGDAARSALSATRPKSSLSAWVWAFASHPHGRDLAHHNVFFTADPAQEFGPLGQGQMPLAPSLYVCAQDREMGTPLPPVERFEIILNGPAGHQPFHQEEAQCRSRTFPALAAMGLTFQPPPGPQALTTPAVLSRLYPGSQGAIYGASPEGAMAAFHRPTARTNLPGLYLAGGGAHPGAGVPMALLSGKHAAAALVADRISASTSAPTAMLGGMSTESRTTERAPSR